MALPQAVQKGLAVALERAAKKLFADMQTNYPDFADQVPKSTAYIRLGGDNIQVGFTDPQVKDLDGGAGGEPIIGIYKQKVKRHTRKLKSGRTIQVKDQVREYNGYKPMKTRQGNWYMASQTPNVGGTRFFTKAYEDNFLGESFNQILKQAIIEQSLKG